MFLNWACSCYLPVVQTNRKHKYTSLNWPLLWTARKKYNNKEQFKNKVEHEQYNNKYDKKRFKTNLYVYSTTSDIALMRLNKLFPWSFAIFRPDQSIKSDIGKPIDKSLSIDKIMLIDIHRLYRSIERNRYPQLFSKINRFFSISSILSIDEKLLILVEILLFILSITFRTK